MKLYFEDVIKDFDDNADVCVMLSSYAEHCGKKYQHCAGNHRASNWVGAIVRSGMSETFVVADIKCEWDEFNQSTQWTITLANAKDEATKRLEFLSNAIAVEGVFGRFC